MSRTVTLLQDCHVETWQYAIRKDWSTCKAGDKITLLTGNGFHTRVYPQSFEDDIERAKNLAGQYPTGVAKEAEDRIAANQYGPCFAGDGDRIDPEIVAYRLGAY
jgi:hypothetical protein